MDKNKDYKNDINKDSNSDNNKDKKDDQYKVKIETFEGPLDLLLHLIKTSEIDVYDIPIAEITKQYLSYLSFLVILDLENITEFIEMATTLMLIKSKAMLPMDVEYDEMEEDPREELISKLLEYQKYKMAAGLLEVRGEENIPLIQKNKGPVLFELDDKEEENWKQLSVLDLIGAFAEVLNKQQKNENEVDFELVLYNYTVEEKIESILKILEEKDSFNYFDLIEADMQKLELVCTFLALLELVKKGMISVRQHKIFGDIHIVRRKDFQREEMIG